jgi:hypothetical protein
MSDDPSKVQGEGGEQAVHDATDDLDGAQSHERDAARPAPIKGGGSQKAAAGRAERKLDKALADSFPASDPMPASPGAD